MKIVIVGSGFGAISFAEKFRTLAPQATICLITRERDGYYSRPLLSHGFSKPGIEQSIILKPFPTLAQNGIEIFSGATVTGIDRTHKTLTFIDDASSQETLSAYDKLILAQGSAAFVPPPFRDNQECFHLLNSLNDLKKLRALRTALSTRLDPVHWAIVGGGLIGCEVASDLALAGDKVTLYHAMDRLMERQLVIEDSAKLQSVLQADGIEVLLEQAVTGFQKQNDKIVINSAKPAGFDAVIVACGFKPHTELAAAAGLSINRGIKVTPFLQTSDPDIFALGDVAELPDGKLYAFILPIRSQAQWLAAYLADGSEQQPWTPPAFKPKAKVHNFVADNPLPF
ncbi:MAG: NAD(P)H-nitrite reductase [Gammaproteobacteria bacterium HGW-Gammaproteobacteria-3]|nr:MAG: NAD(P)H-nitrite reductase [Gammaproteobacteria bacterium HGW-Gammaproteobacteria-3]